MNAEVLLGLFFTFLTSVFVIAGDTILKIAADSGRGLGQPLVLARCTLYAVSALFWFEALKSVTLAQAGVGFSMLTLLSLCAIGAIWFDEPIKIREFGGILAALAAMVLLMRVG